MSARARTKQAETQAHEPLHLDEVVPKIRESEFTQPQRGGKITIKEIEQRLCDATKGMRGTAYLRSNLQLVIAEKIVLLGGDEKILAKMDEIVLALQKIANATDMDAHLVFDILSKDKIADFFVKDPDRFIDALRQISQASGETAYMVYYILSRYEIDGLFVKYPQQFVQIARATRKDAWWAFRALSNDKIADFFVKDPNRLIDAFREITKAFGESTGVVFSPILNDKIADFGESTGAVFSAILNDKIADFFVKDLGGFIDALRQITQAAGENAVSAVGTFSNDKIADLFVKDPGKVARAFREITQAIGTRAWVAFSAISNEKMSESFISWYNGKIDTEHFLIHLSSSDRVATEVGWPLDDLHGEDMGNPNNKRTKYLNSLSSEIVLALLCSNPEFFYTSTNNLLFDRLASDIKSGKFGAQVKGLEDVLVKFGLENTSFHRNFIFRAVNYGRFYGGHSSVFSKEDAQASLAVLLAPLKEKTGFDKTYFYLLANSLENLTPGMRAVAQNELRKCKVHAYSQIGLGFPGAKERYGASTYLLGYLANSEEKAVGFAPSKYRTKDGKLLIVQVFDKKDTKNDHWGLTQQWFAKYGKPTKGENGELIYETENARIVLFMGEDEDANQSFIKNLLSKNTNMLLTFRGHSYSLDKNMPSDIFGNCGCNILFIPGSCGSAGSTPEFLAANPATDLDFISNTSTGRGQVTNALIDIFISEDAKIRAGGQLRTYREILDGNNAKITAQGGDPKTLKASSLGEQMLEYVFRGPN